MINLEYNGNKFKVLYPYSITNSATDVSFSSVSIDFTGYELDDLPYKYQEIKLVDDSINKVIFVGYFDSPEFNEMYLPDEERILTLNLLSPLKMAQVRCVTLIGIYKVKEAVNRILQPLIDDGYIIKELNIVDGEITLNHVLQTVEYCMNDLGHKRSIFWFIDSNKNIYVNSLNYLFSKNEKIILDENEHKKGLFYIKPTMSQSNYANVINIKNIRLLFSEQDYYSGVVTNQGEGILVNVPKNIKKGDVVTFNYPVIVDESWLKKVSGSASHFHGKETLNFSLGVKKSDGTYISYDIGYSDEKYKISKGITYNDDDGEEGEIVLQRDSFFKNLITGFKYNIDDNSTIYSFSSDTALKYAAMRFIDNGEISKLKGVTSDTGQIERTIDYNEGWATIEEITEYAKSSITENINTMNSVELKFDEDYGIEIGNIIEINMPSFYIKGKFAVTNIEYSCNDEGDKEWKIILQNADIVSSYIDIFRPSEQQTTEDTISTIILSEYIEEAIKEIHGIEVIEK